MLKLFRPAVIVLLTLSLALVACSSSKQETEAAQPAPAAAPAMPPEPPPDKATAILETSAGTMTCELFPKSAPETVRAFIGLAEGTKDWVNPFNHKTMHGVPLYNGTVFHRVIPEFMIQGGDPTGTGSGEVGFTLPDEIDPTLKFDRPGRMGVANEGPHTHTGASQFFITEVPTPHLNGGYTVFGQCDAATVTLVKKIARMPRDPRNDRPFEPVKIVKITIVRGTAAPPAAKKAPAGKKP